MKILKLIIFATVSLSAANLFASVYKSVPATHVFVPRGFDTNDDAQVVVSGNLPNLCYKSPKAITKITGTTVSIEIVALSNEIAGTVCAQETVPYLQVISLGTLEQGTYDIKVNSGASAFLSEVLTVKATDSTLIDDFIYAAVDSVDRTEGTPNIVLKGYNPSDCYTLDHVEFKSNGKDTFAVLPIMKRKFDPASICPIKPSPFAYKAEVPNDLTAKTILLHVRTMNGNSYNRLFANPKK